MLVYVYDSAGMCIDSHSFVLCVCVCMCVCTGTGSGGSSSGGGGSSGGSRGRQAKTSAMAGIQGYVNWDSKVTELQQQTEECVVCHEVKKGECSL